MRLTLAPVAALRAVFAGPAAAQTTVSNPWFRFITPQVPSAGYMTRHNAGQTPALLTGASSAACGTLMLQRSDQSGGTDRMVMVDQVTVPPGGTVTFAPGADHMMCMHATMTPGRTVPVTLTFKDGTRVDTDFKVTGATASAQGDHAMKMAPSAQEAAH